MRGWRAPMRGRRKIRSAAVSSPSKRPSASRAQHIERRRCLPADAQAEHGEAAALAAAQQHFAAAGQNRALPSRPSTASDRARRDQAHTFATVGRARFRLRRTSAARSAPKAGAAAVATAMASSKLRASIRSRTSLRTPSPSRTDRSLFSPSRSARKAAFSCGQPFDDESLQVAHPPVAESLRQQQRQKLAIFGKLFAVHSYIRLHRLCGGSARIAGVLPARSRDNPELVPAWFSSIDHRESLAKV